MKYPFLAIDSAIDKVNYKIGFIAQGNEYRKLNNQLSKLVEYRKQLSNSNHLDLKEHNRIFRNFQLFCKRNDINYI